MIKDIVFLIVDIIGIVIITIILAIGLYKYMNKYERLKEDYDLLRTLNSPVNKNPSQLTEKDFCFIPYRAEITLPKSEVLYEESVKVVQLEIIQELVKHIEKDGNVLWTEQENLWANGNDIALRGEIVLLKFKDL